MWKRVKNIKPGDVFWDGILVLNVNTYPTEHGYTLFTLKLLLPNGEIQSMSHHPYDLQDVVFP